MLVWINEVTWRRARLVLSMCGFSSQCGTMTFISVCNEPPRSTQPGHPCVGRHNKYQPKGSEWVAGKTVWSHCYTRAIFEGFRDKGHINNALYKFICLLPVHHHHHHQFHYALLLSSVQTQYLPFPQNLLTTVFLTFSGWPNSSYDHFQTWLGHRFFGSIFLICFFVWRVWQNKLILSPFKLHIKSQHFYFLFPLLSATEM